jgi:aspartyl-tRNA(Asn)/glutamyl-tRNA(Gln) amidotransferase subunit A
MKNLSITEVRKKLLRKELSATEIVQYYLDQIERKNGDLNAYITVLEEEASRLRVKRRCLGYR